MTATERRSPSPTALLIEDDPEIRRWLRVILEAEAYRLLFAEAGEEGVLESAARQPDLILLDLGLPDLDGVEVIRRIRSWSATPILVIFARGQEKDKVDALDAGADDYVSKPFAVGELLSRMRVVLRHAAVTRYGRAASRSRSGGLEVDLAARRVLVDGREIHLTPIEYRLLTAPGVGYRIAEESGGDGR